MEADYAECIAAAAAAAAGTGGERLSTYATAPTCINCCTAVQAELHRNKCILKWGLLISPCFRPLSTKSFMDKYRSVISIPGVRNMIYMIFDSIHKTCGGTVRLTNQKKVCSNEFYQGLWMAS
jgi:hypothetical protein